MTERTERPQPDVETQRDLLAEDPPGDRGNPLPWILVLLVLVVLGWYLLSQRQAVVPEAMPGTPIGDSRPVPSESPVSASQARPETMPRSHPRPLPSRTADREARALSLPKPDYPPVALRNGEEGTVRVRVDLDARGSVVDAAIAQSSGSRELDRAALQGVRQWTFEPAIRDGEPSAARLVVPVSFSLGGETQ